MQIHATPQPVSQMHNVLCKMPYQCVDAYQGSNSYPLDELVLILTNVRHYLAEKVQFVKIVSERLNVNAHRALPVIPLSNVLELPSNNVALIQTADQGKLVSQENVSAEEDLTLTPQLENARILMNVLIQLSLFAELMQCVRIFLEAMNASVPKVSVATHSVDVINALRMVSVAANRLINSLEMNADWPDVAPILIVQLKHNVSKLLEVSVIVHVHKAIVVD